MSEETTSAKEEQHASTVSKELEATCWGCGLRLILASYSPVFKCGWCGAITDKNKTVRTPDSVCFARWRCARDRSLVTVILFFMLCVICGGVWAIYPVVFSISYLCGIFHCIMIATLSIFTLSSYCFSAFKTAGAPMIIQWGSYPLVRKHGLENYTFCGYCMKPKPSRAHHCRSCKMCVLDMDHHCPFIGNCVGASNHRSFIALLIAIVISCLYIFVMAIYTGYHLWPPLKFENLIPAGFNMMNAMNIWKQIMIAFVISAFQLSRRGLILIYLAMISLSVEIGVSLLLWQQLSYIYEGKTYIDQISSVNLAHGEKGCQNLLRFFGCPYSVSRVLLGPGNAAKLQAVSNSKLL